jgi:histone-binding protein RBBP4
MIFKVKIPTGEKEIDAKDNESKIEKAIRINHDGEVNRARYMPNKPNIIATKTTKGEIHIFDKFKHPSNPTDSTVRPELKLIGHEQEGYGLSWSTLQGGLVLSGSNDKKVCIWDINKTPNGTSIQPLKQYLHHTEVVEDVAWNKIEPNIFGSCSDDKKMILYDLRQDKYTHNVEAHTQEVNAIDFNHFNKNLILT